jgi:adenylosuccinate synthase
VSGLSVIGLQWGDEAKGKLVDLFAADHDFVVRYQGGANAGHTVVVGDKVYKLHHLPSGIVHPHATAIVGPGVVTNPKTILGELESLTSQGVDFRGRLLLSDRSHVVMPWHVLEDQLLDRLSGKDDHIGTTMRGIGPCYRDKVGRSHAIRLGDMLRPQFAQRVAGIATLKNQILQAMDPTSQWEPLDAAAITRQYLEYAEALRPMICETTQYLLDALEQGKRVLFEGAQGSLLDIDHGTFPFVTSSNSSGVGVCGGSGVPPKWIEKVVGVVKAYSTRVGGGPMVTELDNEVGQRIRERGREYGTTTGRPRRCGYLDLVALRYTARLSGVSSLAVMMLDVLSGFEQLQVATGYRLGDVVLDRFPSHADDLKMVQPVYETLPGWSEEITTARVWSDLPANAQAYVQRIAAAVGVPVEWVSVGPDRKQTIHCPVGAN